MANFSKKRLFQRFLSLFTAISFLFTTIAAPAVSYAQPAPTGVSGTPLNLPPLGTPLSPSASYTPAIMAGMSLHPENPLEFDFIIDTGDDRLEGEKLREESQRLVSYFLASLTVPEDEMWVNLSPKEKDRIMADGLGKTPLGRDMLAQDYILKQLTASLMNPETDSGAKLWDKLKEKGIDSNILSKVWIVPDKASIYIKDNNVFIADSHLRVMLEEDYVVARDPGPATRATAFGSRETSDESPLTTQIIKESILPEIEREVNEGKHFANLRQIYHALILATWYKENLKNSLLTQIYANQNKTEGITHNDPEVIKQLYSRYIESFKTGAYDYIKEEYDPEAQEVIPKKYFSGGFSAKELDQAMTASAAIAPNAWIRQRQDSAMVSVSAAVRPETSVRNSGFVLEEERVRLPWDGSNVYIWVHHYSEEAQKSIHRRMIIEEVDGLTRILFEQEQEDSVEFRAIRQIELKGTDHIKAVFSATGVGRKFDRYSEIVEYYISTELYRELDNRKFMAVVIRDGRPETEGQKPREVFFRHESKVPDEFFAGQAQYDTQPSDAAMTSGLTTVKARTSVKEAESVDREERVLLPWSGSTIYTWIHRKGKSPQEDIQRQLTIKVGGGKTYVYLTQRNINSIEMETIKRVELEGVNHIKFVFQVTGIEQYSDVVEYYVSTELYSTMNDEKFMSVVMRNTSITGQGQDFDEEQRPRQVSFRHVSRIPNEASALVYRDMEKKKIGPFYTNVNGVAFDQYLQVEHPDLFEIIDSRLERVGENTIALLKQASFMAAREIAEGERNINEIFADSLMVALNPSVRYANDFINLITGENLTLTFSPQEFSQIKEAVIPFIQQMIDQVDSSDAAMAGVKESTDENEVNHSQYSEIGVIEYKLSDVEYLLDLVGDREFDYGKKRVMDGIKAKASKVIDDILSEIYQFIEYIPDPGVQRTRYRNYFRSIFAFAIENTIDSYLQRVEDSEGYEEPLQIKFYLYSKNGELRIRMIANGVDWENAEPSEVKMEKRRLGGRDQGIKMIIRPVSRTVGGRFFLFDRRSKIGDNDGSVFELRLEKSKVREFFELIDQDVPAAADAAMATGKVLVSIHYSVIREIVASTLRDSGYEVVEAKGNQNALDMFAEKPSEFSAIITNNVYSDMSSVDLAREASRISGNHVRVIMMNDELPSLESAREFIADKPFITLALPTIQFFDLEEEIKYILGPAVNEEAFPRYGAYKGAVVAIQGAGNIGSRLIDPLLNAGATVVVGEADPDKIRKLRRDYGQYITEKRFVLIEERRTEAGYTHQIFDARAALVKAGVFESMDEARVDLVMPAAGGLVINDETIQMMVDAGVKALVGSANNMMADLDTHPQKLKEANILTLADFGSNFGGATGVSGHIKGVDNTDAGVRRLAVENALADFRMAQTKNMTTQQAAEKRAQDFIEANLADKVVEKVSKEEADAELTEINARRASGELTDEQWEQMLLDQTQRENNIRNPKRLSGYRFEDGTVLTVYAYKEELPQEAQKFWDDHYAVYEFRNDGLGEVNYVSIHRATRIESNVAELDGRVKSSGGTRWRSEEYPQDVDAMIDALELSREMTFKFAAAGVPIGGSKSARRTTSVNPSPGADSSERQRRQVSYAWQLAFMDLTGAGVLTGQDINTSEADVELWKETAPLSITPNPELHSGLTREPSPPTAISVYNSAAVALDFSQKGLKKILVVDDDATVRRSTVKVLTRAGYQVFEAGSVDEALKVLRSHPEGRFSGVVTDKDMPEIDEGLRLAELVKKWFRLPLILFSGRISDDIVAEFKEKPGVKEVVSKPFEVEDFNLVVEQTFGPAIEKPKGPAKEILLVDDEELHRMLPRAVLTQSGYVITEAKNGLEALEILRANPGRFSLVITDNQMPMMLGIELAAAIREEFPGLPVMMQTGDQNIDELKQQAGSSLQQILSKPFSGDLFLTIVEEIIGPAVDAAMSAEPQEPLINNRAMQFLLSPVSASAQARTINQIEKFLTGDHPIIREAIEGVDREDMSDQEIIERVEDRINDPEYMSIQRARLYQEGRRRLSLREFILHPMTGNLGANQDLFSLLAVTHLTILDRALKDEREKKESIEDIQSLYLALKAIEAISRIEDLVFIRDEDVREGGDLFWLLHDNAKDPAMEFSIREVVPTLLKFGDFFIDTDSKRPRSQNDRESLVNLLQLFDNLSDHEVWGPLIRQTDVQERIEEFRQIIPTDAAMGTVAYVYSPQEVLKKTKDRIAVGVSDRDATPIITVDDQGNPINRLGPGKTARIFTYRQDRERQFMLALQEDFDQFDVPPQWREALLVGATRYIPDMTYAEYLVPDQFFSNSLPEVYEKEGRPFFIGFSKEKYQFRVKVRGNQTKPFGTEDEEFINVEIPVWPEGPKEGQTVANTDYWMFPSLSVLRVAQGIAKKIKQYAKNGGGGFVNLDVGDLLTHISATHLDNVAVLYVERPDGSIEKVGGATGYESLMYTARALDEALRIILDALKEVNGAAVLIPDHGSIDNVRYPGHTGNDVPFWVVDFQDERIKEIGKPVEEGKINNLIRDTGLQKDAAPTHLQLAGIEKPEEMTGESLLVPGYPAGHDKKVVVTVLLDGFGLGEPGDRMDIAQEALKRGWTPTLAWLHANIQMTRIPTSGYVAGLRGGKEKDYPKEQLLERQAAIEQLQSLEGEVQKVKLIEVSYDFTSDPPKEVEAQEVHTYEVAFSELVDSPYLHDRFFVFEKIQDSTLTIIYFDQQQIGSTEFNTAIIADGRIVPQEVSRIDQRMHTGEYFENDTYRETLNRFRQQGYAHLIGILQESVVGVHASLRHLYYEVAYLKSQGITKFMFDFAIDGRDEDKYYSEIRLQQVMAAMEYFDITDYHINVFSRDLLDRAQKWNKTQALLYLLYLGRLPTEDESWKPSADDAAMGIDHLKRKLTGEALRFRIEFLNLQLPKDSLLRMSIELGMTGFYVGPQRRNRIFFANPSAVTIFNDSIYVASFIVGRVEFDRVFLEGRKVKSVQLSLNQLPERVKREFRIQERDKVGGGTDDSAMVAMPGVDTSYNYQDVNRIIGEFLGRWLRGGEVIDQQGMDNLLGYIERTVEVDAHLQSIAEEFHRSGIIKDGLTRNSFLDLLAVIWRIPSDVREQFVRPVTHYFQNEVKEIMIRGMVVKNRQEVALIDPVVDVVKSMHETYEYAPSIVQEFVEGWMHTQQMTRENAAAIIGYIRRVDSGEHVHTISREIMRSRLVQNGYVQNKFLDVLRLISRLPGQYREIVASRIIAYIEEEVSRGGITITTEESVSQDVTTVDAAIIGENLDIILSGIERSVEVIEDKYGRAYPAILLTQGLSGIYEDFLSWAERFEKSLQSWTSAFHNMTVDGVGDLKILIKESKSKLAEMEFYLQRYGLADQLDDIRKAMDAILGDPVILTDMDIDLGEPVTPADNAMNNAQTAPGGIDFNADKLDITVEGDPIRFEVPAEFKNLTPGSVYGLTPVIINITPITNFPMLLGFDTEKKPSVVRKSQSHTSQAGELESLLLPVTL